MASTPFRLLALLSTTLCLVVLPSYALSQTPSQTLPTTEFVPAKTPLPSPTSSPNNKTKPSWLATTPLATTPSSPTQNSDKDKKDKPVILQPTLEAMLKEANRVTTYNVPAPPQTTATPLTVESYVKQLPEQQQRQVWTSLGLSAAKLQKEITDFHIVLLNTEDPIVRSFSAQGLLKRSEAKFIKETHGLASFLLQNAIINDKKITACYVVYDASLSGHVWRNFIVPMQDIEKGTDFLMAHEVGHCLDNHQLNQALAKQDTLNLEEGKQAGIEPHAWERYAKDKDISQKTFNELSQSVLYDSAQVQYRERGADAFALLWLWKQQGPENAIELLSRTRANQSPWSSHNTGDVFKGMESLYEKASSGASLENLWTQARTQQMKVGVDQSVVEGPHAGIPPKKEPESQIASAPKTQDPPVSEKPPLPKGVFTLPSLGSQVTFSETPIDPTLLNGKLLNKQTPKEDTPAPSTK